ncbi:hypothetical protein (plasmid) [Metabacillus dongyingensis]|nr:hypothetical protein [Metabacillus dongyingensis]
MKYTKKWLSKKRPQRPYSLGLLYFILLGVSEFQKLDLNLYLITISLSTTSTLSLMTYVYSIIISLIK